MEILEKIMLLLMSVAIASICLCRGVQMNRRAALLPKLAMTGLVICSIATMISLLPDIHWNRDVIFAGFMISTLGLMYASRDMWKDGLPEIFLKWSERYPQKERRERERRERQRQSDTENRQAQRRDLPASK